VFSEVFLVQICQNFRVIGSEVRIQGKKNSKNVFRILKPRAKKEIRREKKRWGVKRIFLVTFFFREIDLLLVKLI
jgi:hypothetical protein